MLTKNISKVTSIALIRSACKSANVGEQNSQSHRVSISPLYVFLKTELENYCTKIQASRSLRDPANIQNRGSRRHNQDNF